MFDPQPIQQALTLANKQFVTQAISELVQNRCEIKVSNQTRQLSVVSNSMGMQRMVINSLRYLNGHLWRDKFKYEYMCIVMLLFELGDDVFSLDLKPGYQHMYIDILDPRRQFLGFCWEQGGSEQFYIFTVLTLV